tara:strand:- start:268 stop:585 length:318 start_codon:yes stop_codon:yes gene_type:complete
MGSFRGGDENINRKGRTPGIPNKNTMAIREAYQKLTEDNLDNMSIWITQVAGDDPAKALDIMIRLSEYIIPKLARTELSGNDGEDLFKNISFKFGPDINDPENRD